MPWNVWDIDNAGWAYLQSVGTKAAAEELMGISQSERPGASFEVRKTGSVLEEHGTKLMQLKPSMVWRCAMDDLERRKHNEGLKTFVGVPLSSTFKHYAFHRRHVVKASTANDILRAAIAEPGLGLASGKKDTRLLYSDVELLKAALQ